MDKEKQMLKKIHAKGFLLALIASSLWGISGVILDFVSRGKSLPVNWFIGVRTLTAGTLILLVALITLPKGQKGKIFDIFKNKTDIMFLLLFVFFGLLGNLYSFFLSVQSGGAASATILQYLSPLFIVASGILFFHQKPTRVDLISFFLALVGIILLITKGDVTTLSIPPKALFWGIISGATAAMYIAFPARLIAKHSPLIVTGWGFFLSGIFWNLIHPFWINAPKLDTSSILGVGAVILIGTVGAFLIMVMSLQYTTSTIVSITDAVQPFVTFILSILFLHTTFSLIEIVGAIIVVLSIYILNKYNSQ